MQKFYPTVAGKVCLAFSFVLLFSIPSHSQIRTYDTTFDGWNAIVTEDLSLHGNDSAAGIVFFPGIGQQTKNINDLKVNGPHYLISNGMWDGSVPLGNGVHHPYIISLQPPSPDNPASYVKPKIDAILARYRIKRNSFFMTGLSLGGWQANEFVTYQPTSGDRTYGKMVRAIVNLEGVEPADYTGIYAGLPYPGKMGDWAKNCGGRELWVEGKQDWRDMLAGAQNMTDAVPGSATYFQVTYGGGAHCCWNTEYTPSVTWTSKSNSNISQVVGNQVPMNVWQWLLRQGDTSMPGGAAAPAVVGPTANAGPAQNITLPANSANLNGSGAVYNGAKVSAMSWAQTSGPNNSSIKAGNLVQAALNTVANIAGAVTGTSANLNATASGLVAGDYTFQLTVKDNNGKQSTSSVKVTVNAAPAPPATTPKPPASTTPKPPASTAPATPPAPTVSAGKGQVITLPANSLVLNGTATGNGGATVKSLTWKQGTGPVAAKVSSPASLNTTVSGMTVAGSYVFTLYATDNNGKTADGSVTVTVNPAPVASKPASPASGSGKGAPPTVSAGKGQVITLPASATTLKGTATGNDGATVKALTWAQVKGPVATKIGSAASLATTVSGLTVAGEYVYMLTATDNNGMSANGSMTVTVEASAAREPPTVSAGPNQTITLPISSVALQGTAMGHNGAVVNSYFWNFVSGPTWVKFSDEWSPATTVSGMAAGTYVFELSASDNTGETTASAPITVVVKPKPAAAAVSAGATPGEGAPTADQLAIDSINQVVGLVIYPNPVHDLLNIHLNSQLRGKMTLAIFNSNGSRMQSIEVDKETWSFETSVDVGRLAAGVYVIEVICGPNLRKVDKFIKQ